jgi:hypothetical protein
MTPARGSRTASDAGLVGLLASAGFTAAWYLVVEAPGSCDQTGVFACMGDDLLLVIFGIPITYVLWPLGLRLAKAPMPWLAPFAVLTIISVLVSVTLAIEPPLWIWPVIASIICGLWTRLLEGVVSSPR